MTARTHNGGCVLALTLSRAHSLLLSHVVSELWLCVRSSPTLTSSPSLGCLYRSPTSSLRGFLPFQVLSACELPRPSTVPFSTFSMHKTYKDVYEDILTDGELTKGMMHNEPRAMAEWNRRMSGGEKVSPEYEEIVERMDNGEWPVEQIEAKRKEFNKQMTASENQTGESE